MKVPKSVASLIEAFETLPGIGPKTAARLTYYLLHAPDGVAQKLAEAAGEVKTKTKICAVCQNITEVDPCEVCEDPSRDQSIICVVEDPLDVWAIEKSGSFNGIYHVLHGVIAPLGLKITRIARGIPIGAEIEYADEVTVRRALEGRKEY